MIKDAFISYGRRESLGFVGRLHALLKLRGFDVWFDKVNIPDGDDYAKRIAHGIESAHNFILILAPHCLTSPYCLIELEYAKLLGKRIIPVNQSVIFDCQDRLLSDQERKVIREFYESNRLPVINLTTQKEVLLRSHELLGKIDWVYGRQELTEDDIYQLYNWQLSYENNWKKHEEISFLETNPIPVFGKDIDEFSSVVESIVSVIQTQQDYVAQHTDLLAKALFWVRNRRQTAHLLVGAERQKAQDWLTKVFVAPEQPPCTPSVLHSEFITESKRNADNLMTEVFLCYAPQELDEATRLKNGLNRSGITVALPPKQSKDRSKGFDYSQEVEMQIAQSDNFVFVLSPASVKFGECLRELRMALQFNKRIIIVLAKEVEQEELPEALRTLPCIDLTDNRTTDHFTAKLDFEADLTELITIIEQDYDYYRNHKRYLMQAIKWQKQHQNDAILLRGHNLDNAQTWLAQSKHKDHRATALHERFIEISTQKVGTLSSEVFISYSRTDGDFARWLNEELQLNGRTTWFDQECIPAGSDFGKEIRKGIETSDNFLFLISPSSIASPYCESEVRHALVMGKRFITILLQEVPKLPTYFPSHIQWIDFAHAKKDKNQQFREVLRALNSDREHIQRHSKLLQKALDWDTNNREDSFLLRGSELVLATSWLEEAKNAQKKPTPTLLQEQFIKRSEEKAQYTRQKQQRTILRLRLFLALAVLALLGSLGLGLWVHSLNLESKRRAKELEAAYDSLETKTKKELALKYKNYKQEADYQFAFAEYEKAIKSYSIALDFADSAQQVEIREKIKQSQNLSSQKDTFFELLAKGDDQLSERNLIKAREYYNEASSIGYDPALVRRKLQVLQGFFDAEVYRLRERALYLMEAGKTELAYTQLEKALRLAPNDMSLNRLKERIMSQMLFNEKENR